MRRGALIIGTAFVMWMMFAAGFWVGHASADPGQELADEMAECIAVSVGAPPMYRDLVPAAVELNADGLLIVGSVSSDRPTEAKILPEMLWSWGRAATGTPPGPWTNDAVATVMHELAHRAPLTWSFDPYLEEGATEAIVADLLPSCSKRTLGYVIHYSQVLPSYQEQVAFIRSRSARAVGAGWRTRPARLWRRAFYLADRDTRRLMILTTERGGVTP